MVWPKCGAGEFYDVQEGPLLFVPTPNFALIPYVPSILSQLLNLITLARINLFVSRFEFYDPLDMASYLSQFILKFFFKDLRMWKFSLILSKIRTQEPGPVLEIFEFDPYSFTYVLRFGSISMGHMV